MAVMPSRTRRDTQLLAGFVDSGRNVMHAAALLRELLAQWPDESGLLGEIVAAEHEGDRIAHDILHRLAERGSPLDAADVHALTCALDDVVDYADEAADRLSLYRVEAATDQAVEIAEVLVLATREVAAALEALAEGGDLSARLIEIHRLENEADRLVRAAVATLFVDGIDPMAVIRWKDIFETLEAAIDACETVANVLEGMSLKRRSSLRK
jgi:predicted phosphate transport protein (TIGR00153 family)